MAYQKPFIKLTWGGAIASNQDIFSCGLHYAPLEGELLTVDNWEQIGDEMESLAGVVSAFHKSAESRTPSGAVLQWIKLALIGTDGKYMAEPHEWIFSTPQAGGTTGAYIPQVSTVVTLESTKFKDPGKYNRFYLPSAAPTGSNVYSLTSAQTDALATRAATFIDDLAFSINTDAGSLGFYPKIVSQLTNEYLSVTNVRVGNIFDTQRRRRNGIREEYSNAPTGTV